MATNLMPVLSLSLAFVRCSVLSAPHASLHPTFCRISPASHLACLLIFVSIITHTSFYEQQRLTSSHHQNQSRKTISCLYRSPRCRCLDAASRFPLHSSPPSGTHRRHIPHVLPQFHHWSHPLFRWSIPRGSPCRVSTLYRCFRRPQPLWANHHYHHLAPHFGRHRAHYPSGESPHSYPSRYVLPRLARVPLQASQPCRATYPRCLGRINTALFPIHLLFQHLHQLL